MAPAVGAVQARSAAVFMFGVNVVVAAAISLVAPFLPQYLAERCLLPPGPLGDSMKGMLFAFSPVSTLIVTPCVPVLLRRCGKATTCTGGLLLFSVGTLIFGLTDHIVALAAGEVLESVAPHPHVELALLFAARVASSAGGAAATLGSTSIALEANPESRGMLIGASETALGVGFSFGPSLGAAFFTAGGFPLPFAVTAAMSLGLLPLLLLGRRGPHEATTEEEAGEAAKEDQSCAGNMALGSPPAPWSSPAVLSVATMAMSSLFGFGFMDPTLAPFEARTLGASAAGVGVLFSCSALPYAALGSIIGAAVDAAPRRAPAMICGGGVALGAAIFLVPPLAPFMATWAWQSMVFFLMGAAASLAMVPVVPLMITLLQEKAQATGRRDVDEAVVLSFSSMAFTLGELTGPLAGSYFAGTCGFPSSARGVGVIILLAAVTTVALLGAAGQFASHGDGGAQFTAAALPLLDLERKSSVSSSCATEVRDAHILSRAVSGSFNL